MECAEKQRTEAHQGCWLTFPCYPPFLVAKYPRPSRYLLINTGCRSYVYSMEVGVVDVRHAVVETLTQRGLLHQVTEGLVDACKQPLTVYCGFDPTAASLHLGNMIPVMMLAHFQRHGHRPIILVGGGTGLIGDPSGKLGERRLLDPETVASYVARIRSQISRFLSFEGPNGALVVDNAEWLSHMNLIAFLRDIGKHITVNAMMAKESVRARLEERAKGISFTEFGYMLLQATDFLHLYRHYGCSVQAGGSDQWGNITAGIDLIRRKLGGVAHGVTGPLLTTASGAKFGKSEAGALWLDGEMTSPYDLYQYLINTADQDVKPFLTIFTFLTLDEINALDVESRQNPSARVMQRRLAYDLVAFIHGVGTARAVERAAQMLFGAEVTDMDEATLAQVLRAIPTAMVSATDMAIGIPVTRAAIQTGLVPSVGAARKLISQGGLYLNNRRWTDHDALVTSQDLLLGKAVLLRAGRKTYGALTVDH